MSARSAGRVFAGLFVAIAAVPSQAAAGEPVAEALFDEGVRLLTAGKVGEACATLDRAVDMAGSAAIGGLLLLGECREKEGRPASAWATYRRAVAAARRAGDAREAKATEAVNRLEPTLPHVRVEVAPALAARADLAVRLGGTALPREAWGLPVPVDPGMVSVEAELPSLPRWTTEIRVTMGLPTQTVAITPWSVPVVSPPVQHDPLVQDKGLHALGIVGVTLGALGLGGLGVSVGVAVDAKARYRTAIEDPAHACSLGSCNAAGKTAADAARAQGNAATAIMVAGAVLGASGGVMLAVDLLRGRGGVPAIGVRGSGSGVWVEGVY